MNIYHHRGYVHSRGTAYEIHSKTHRNPIHLIFAEHITQIDQVGLASPRSGAPGGGAIPVRSAPFVQCDGSFLPGTIFLFGFFFFFFTLLIHFPVVSSYRRASRSAARSASRSRGWSRIVVLASRKQVRKSTAIIAPAMFCRASSWSREGAF